MIEQTRIGVFGEVLVDQFPDRERVLGGAAFNVAWHLEAFGQSPRLISRIGSDEDGEAIRATMVNWGMDVADLQTDLERPSGCVTVQFEDGEPSYDILPNRAYDMIDESELTDASYDLLYHGTLALRSTRSRAALEHLKRTTHAAIFLDVNLRDPWWNQKRVSKLADDATWVKLNAHELAELTRERDDELALAQRFLKDHDLAGLILTRGERGAMAITAAGQRAKAAPAKLTQVIDTVGAGDAFAAVMMVGIVRDWPLEASLQRAQEFASIIVQNRGAILNDRSLYTRLIDSWED